MDDLGGIYPLFSGQHPCCLLAKRWLLNLGQVWAKADVKLHHGPFHVRGASQNFLKPGRKGVLFQKTGGKIGGPKYQSSW